MAKNKKNKKTKAKTSKKITSEEVINDDAAVDATETTKLEASANEAAQDTKVEVASEEEAIEMEAAIEVEAAEKTSEIEEPVIDENLITDADEIERALEAIIFASPKAITLRRIKSIMRSFSFYVENVTDYLESLTQKYETSGFQLVKVAGTYQFRSNPSQSDILQKLLEDKPVRISASALEVLSVISYKQPVSRAEIDAVRGVDSGHLTRGLMEKNLIKVTGHAETPGRPLLYGTTPYFLEVFTLDSLDSLPSLEEFNRELSDSSNADGPDEGTTIATANSGDLDEAAEFFDKESPLAATPDRGDFDEPSEEEIEVPDFGLAERALEETP